MNRREFLGLGAMVGANAVLGCSSMSKKNGGNICSGGAPMINFAAPAMKRIRVGVVGLGARGAWAVNRLSMIPGVDVRAVCDVEQDRVDAKVKWAEANGKPTIKGFGGREDSWRNLCEYDGIDVVYNTTPWQLHAKVSVYAMECGKHTFIEVPAAMTLDECWQLVETSEKTRLHCMQLENGCYREVGLAAHNMIRAGIFGELTHGEAGYIHDLTEYNWNGYWKAWRLEWNRLHRGDQYPTHDLGPIARAMDITRGDYFDYLVSLDSPQASFELWAKEHLPEGDMRRNIKVAMGDMTTTLIKTMSGKSIMLQHDVSTPRPRVATFMAQGPGGHISIAPGKTEITLRDFNHKGAYHHEPLDQARTNAELKKYAHPLWKKAGEIAKLGGGHGGIDFMMDLVWAYCLQNGLPLDQDVYELASWCAVCELSERSVRSGSMPQKFPDFTRGAWKTTAPRPFMDLDFNRIDIKEKTIGKDGTEMKV